MNNLLLLLLFCLIAGRRPLVLPPLFMFCFAFFAFAIIPIM
jgi:hypothetical protein